MTKQEMISKLLKASDAYYNLSESIITDEEFDSLKDEFEKLYPDDPFLNTIGSEVARSSEWEKATHKIPMGSLNKVMNEAEFNKWAEQIESLCVSEKLDGISIDLEYESSNLVKAITRGDGIEGEDITKNVKRMQNVKSKFNFLNFTGSVRGEIILKQHDFETIAEIQKQRDEKPIKNLRNGASGIAKRYDGKYSEYLSIIYFDVTGNFDTKSEKFSFIETELEIPTSLVVNFTNHINVQIFTVNDVKRVYQEYENARRPALDYEIDGLVIEENNIKKYNELGELNKRPRGAVAFKFKSLKKETKVKDIIWQLGNSGRITPVALLEPVQMGGVEVKRATLHNFEIFKNLQLSAGSDVLVSRRGDVIPYIEKVVSYQRGSLPFEPIKFCPECGCPVSPQYSPHGKFLVCPNENCDGAMIGNLIKWSVKSGMQSEGIGSKTIEKLYEAGFLVEPSDFYTTSTENIELLEGFGKRSAQLFVDNVNRHREISLADFIGGLNIENFGSSMAKLLVKEGYDTIEKIENITFNELVKIKGIEEKTANVFLNGINKKVNIIKNLLMDGVKIMETNGKLSGKSFCFTGAVQATDENGERYKRAVLESLVKENGGEVKSVSGGLTYLVQADPTSQSGKTNKALNLGVEIISDVDFLQMVGK